MSHVHGLSKTEIQSTAPAKGGLMGRLIAFCYGAATYAFFVVTFLYAVGFVAGFGVPKTIDDGAVVPVMQAVAIDLVLLTLFALQHSVMARPQFKAWWTKFVPQSIERSTYVLFATLVLALLLWQWRPLPVVLWHIDNPTIATVVTGISLFGSVFVLVSTFLINHFELFGLHQVANNLVGRAMPETRFRTPLLYGLVRHPIYLGFIIAFWAAPTMTVGHLMFAAVTTTYILVAIQFEEHDLIALFGDEYRQYKKRVSMLVPWRRI